ncbi:protein VASP homolog, partial [Setaria italica]|uniref:protein VASP homolog n=1 Tax=Setaria italica TaxID=4555 RepID=UPI000350BFF3
PTTTSFDSYQFDFGVNASRSSGSRPLRDQHPGAAANTSTRPATGASWTHQPASTKPAWTHQPSPAAASAAAGPGSGPTSMVGDIFGRSWSSAAPSSGLGIPQANNPALFSDLLGSALGGSGSSRTQSNAPLRSSAAPQASRPIGSFQSADAGFGSFQSSGATKPSSFTSPPPPAPAPTPAAAAANSSVDPLDNLFASTTAAPAATTASNGGGGGDMFGEMDGWVDVEAEFGGGDSGGATT